VKQSLSYAECRVKVGCKNTRSPSYTDCRVEVGCREGEKEEGEEEEEEKEEENARQGRRAGRSGAAERRTGGGAGAGREGERASPRTGRRGQVRRVWTGLAAGFSVSARHDEIAHGLGSDDAILHTLTHDLRLDTLPPSTPRSHAPREHQPPAPREHLPRRQPWGHRQPAARVHRRHWRPPTSATC